MPSSGAKPLAPDEFISHLPALLLVFDRDEQVVCASRELLDLAGDAAHSLECFHDDERDRLLQAVRSCLTGGAPVAIEVQLRDREGERVEAHWRLCAVPRNAVIAVATESRRLLAERLSRSERETARARRELEMHKAALDEHAIVAVTDPAGRITYANDKFCEISKYSAEELLGKDHRIVNSGFHPRAFFRELWGTITRGEVFRGEIRNRAKDGSYYWVDTTIVPIKDERGRITEYVGIRTDITEQKRMNEKLLQSAKFAALGELAAHIAHEVNNPIGVISGKARLLLSGQGAGLPEKVGSDLEKIVGLCDRLAEMTRRLLDFCRPASGARVRLDVTVPLHRAIELVRHRAERGGIRLKVDIDPEHRYVRASGNELEQVFLNLLLNAADAMPGGGDLSVTIHGCRYGGVPAIAITVRDTGTGIDPEIRHRIFDPFFTTKSDRQGTGLGLSISYNIVQRHGGDIEVDSEPGRGTQFRVFLGEDRGACGSGEASRSAGSQRPAGEVTA